MANRTVLVNGKRALGQKEYAKLQSGGKLTKNQQIKAMCYDCQGGYADYVGDCETNECPLYASHPYNPNRERRHTVGVGFKKKNAVLPY